MHDSFVRLSVHRIADKRGTEGRKMNPYLMRSARFERDVQKRDFSVGSDRFPMGDGSVAAFVNGADGFDRVGSVNRGFNGSASLKMTARKSKIAFFDFAAQSPCGMRVERTDNKTACALVESADGTERAGKPLFLKIAGNAVGKGIALMIV